MMEKGKKEDGESQKNAQRRMGIERGEETRKISSILICAGLVGPYWWPRPPPASPGSRHYLKPTREEGVCV
jgi:hypothetical protein